MNGMEPKKKSYFGYPALFLGGAFLIFFPLFRDGEFDRNDMFRLHTDTDEEVTHLRVQY